MAGLRITCKAPPICSPNYLEAMLNKTLSMLPDILVGMASTSTRSLSLIPA
ncbi:hypothetical protein RvY_06397 [Ramazzottius varieornatus]|uniref:Uncharacterized protein n=1 Tax=Ramazzottius varieornatus TaxID=947166 RepID=A0A1D1V4S6_RAMVA|nr:hypothetical protein RvY_06397 [Ramazzottius varieornatus]